MLSPFESYMIGLLKCKDQPDPLPTNWISRKVAMPERTTRYYLNKLEAVDLVARPAGTRGGWAFGAAPFEVYLLATLRRCERDVQGAVPTRVLEARMGMAERTVRFHLRRLEDKGSVHRPVGERRGYACALNHTAWRVLGLLRSEAQSANAGPKLYRTGQVAALVNVPERTARHYLRRLEEAGAVRRPLGPKSGWMVA